jgi:predicted transcriptional regulator
MGGLSDFERRQIVGERFAGASVIRAATLLGASRATVSMFRSAYTNHGKTSAKMNSKRKLTVTERDSRAMRRIDSKNHSTVAQVTAELKTVFQKKSQTKEIQHPH